MAITLTPKASERVNHYLTEGNNLGIRLAVETNGCSGLGYRIELTDSIDQDDVIFEESGFKILVDKKSLIYLDGTEIDFIRDGVNEGFEFKNPNAKAQCGCGESFTV